MKGLCMNKKVMVLAMALFSSGLMYAGGERQERGWLKTVNFRAAQVCILGLTVVQPILAKTYFYNYYDFACPCNYGNDCDNSVCHAIPCGVKGTVYEKGEWTCPRMGTAPLNVCDCRVPQN